MSRESYVALVALIALALASSVAASVNCSDIEPFWVFQERVGFQVHPARIEAFPAYNGKRATQVGVLWEPTAIMERNRTFYNTTGGRLLKPECAMPGQQDPFIDDPYLPCKKNLNYPCGPILRIVPFSEMTCTASNTTDIYHGVERTTLAFEHRHPSYPDMLIIFKAYLVNQSLTVYPFNDPENPYAIKNRYRVGHLKFGYDFYNFPWLHPGAPVKLGWGNNGTYIYATFRTTFSVAEGNVTVTQEELSLSAQYMSANRSVSLGLGVDQGVIVDDVAYNEPSDDLGTETYNISPGDTLDLPLWSNLHICTSEIGQWSNATFDPFLTALFVPGPDEKKSTTPAQKKDRKVAIIASAVSVGVVLLALIVFTILVFTVPSIRSKVSPASQRLPKSAQAREMGDNSRAATTTSSATTTKPNVVRADASTAPAASPGRAASKSTWARASKPTE